MSGNFSEELLSDNEEAYKTIRIRTEIKEMLDELCSGLGLSRMAIVGILVKSLHESQKKWHSSLEGITTKEFAELRKERIT